MPDNSSQSPQHWAKQQERGSYWLMKFTAIATRLLGRRLMTPLIYLIVCYFFITGRKARNSAREYQQKLALWSGNSELLPSTRRIFKQFMSFAEALLDKLDVWHERIGLNDIEVEDPAVIRPKIHQATERGQLLVGAHLGNLEVCRALAEKGKKVRMNVLVHTRHAEQFNRLLGETGSENLRLIQVSELDPATMLLLSQRLDAGEWLAIAGDRVPLQGSRYSEVEFLGALAHLPQGPWLLAGILKCPVNLLFCLKHGSRYRVCLEPFSQQISWQRSTRELVIQQSAQRYADRLAERCLEAPYQWFNFYPFWNRNDH